jgi:hypothetical protein
VVGKETASEVGVACLSPANGIGRQISLAIPGLTGNVGSRILRDNGLLYIFQSVHLFAIIIRLNIEFG